MKQQIALLDLMAEYQGGHFLPLHIATQEAVKILGWPFVLIVDRDCPVSEETADWSRVLYKVREMDHGAVADLVRQRRYLRAAGMLVRQFRMTVRLAFDLLANLRALGRRAHRIILHIEWYGPLHLLAAWASLWMYRLSGGRARDVCVWLVIHHEGMVMLKLTRLAIRLIEKSGASLRFSAFTAHQAADVGPKIGHKVIALPLPMHSSRMRRITRNERTAGMAPPRPAMPLRVWIPGRRPLQGKEHVMGLLRHPTLAGLENGPVELRISEVYLPEGAAPSEGMILTKLPAWLSDEAYVAELVECEAIMLPYDSSVYRNPMSAIFTEAVITGRPTFVSEDTSMAQELRRHGLGAMVVDWTNGFSWAQVARLARDPEINAKVMAMALHYREERGAGNYAESIRRELAWN